MSNQTVEEKANRDFHKQLSSFYQSHELADVKILVSGPGNGHLDAHGIILCSRSPYFKRCLVGPFVEGRTKEVDLRVHDREAVCTAIRWMYEGDYDTKSNDDKSDYPYASRVTPKIGEIVKKHIRTAEIAQYFDMPALVRLAKVKLSAKLNAAPLTDAHEIVGCAVETLYAGPAEESVKEEFLKYCRRCASKRGPEGKRALSSIVTRFNLYPDFARDLIKQQKSPQKKK